MSSAPSRLWLVIVFAALAVILGRQEANAGSMHASHSSSHSSTHAAGHSSGHYRPGHYHNYNGMTASGFSDSPDYEAGQGVATGAQFSGPAHIDPSQYHYFVQEYQWPSSSTAN